MSFEIEVPEKQTNAMHITLSTEQLINIENTRMIEHMPSIYIVHYSIVYLNCKYHAPSSLLQNALNRVLFLQKK